MKRSLEWCGLILTVLLAAGCGTSGNRAADAAGMEEDVKEGRILSERETPDGTRQGISVRIYHSNTEAQGLCVNTVRVEEVTPEVLVWNLASYGMIPEDTEVEKLQKKTDGGALVLSLDLSEEFKGWFGTLDENFRELVKGSLVNTFLDAYEGVEIRITVEGESLEADLTDSDEYQQFYPYQEASYTLVWTEFEAEGVRIRYPQLKGVANQELEERWNERIRERVQRTAESVEPGTAYEESCIVKTMNDEVLSLLMEGEYQNADAPYPSVVRFTYNIDMAHGINIRLAHHQDVEKLAENLLNGVGYTVQGESVEEFLPRLSILYSDAEQLASVLKGYDFGADGDVPTGYSYQEDGYVHLCMEAPHALGDYVDIVLDGE